VAPTSALINRLGLKSVESCSDAASDWPERYCVHENGYVVRSIRNTRIKCATLESMGIKFNRES
jgi:hypothetical protein